MQPVEKSGSLKTSLRRLWEHELAALSKCNSAEEAGLHPVRRFVCYVRRLVEAYVAHQCSLMACACAYCLMLSLIPLLVVGIAALGFFLGGNQAALHDTL